MQSWLGVCQLQFSYVYVGHFQRRVYTTGASLRVYDVMQAMPGAMAACGAKCVGLCKQASVSVYVWDAGDLHPINLT